MTITDQIIHNNIESNNKKICLVPIFDCLDGCFECNGTYFSNNINDYYICRCKCHNKPKLISDNERIPGPAAFKEMIIEHIRNGGDPNVF